MTKTDFVVKYYSFAKQIENEYGIPASLTLAQSGLETGWGTSTPGNMMFGKKAPKGWLGKKQLLTTKEYTRNLELAEKQYPVIISSKKQKDGRWLLTVKDWFIAYDSPLDSFRDYAKLITGKYYRGWESFKTDHGAVARHIAKKGYATAPQYGEILARLVSEIDVIFKKKILTQE